MTYATDTVTGQQYASATWFPKGADLCLMPDGSYRRVGEWTVHVKGGEETRVRVSLDPLEPDHRFAPETLLRREPCAAPTPD